VGDLLTKWEKLPKTTLVSPDLARQQIAAIAD
jgi:hypothetical protein